MKLVLRLILLSSILSGCATPLVIDNGAQSKVFIPCENDILCFRDTYNVAWDNRCPNVYRDFPVSYRTKQTEFESSRVEYILLPHAVAPASSGFGGVQ